MNIHEMKGLNRLMQLNFFRMRAATRSGYGDALVEIGRRSRKIMVLCADLSDSTRVGEFRKKFPAQFVEIGVAEQNLVTVAAGLAAVGKTVFCSSYAAFCPGRCWEQIRTTICYNNQNVKVIGAHAGISVGPDGATHQALEDIAIMRALPNMKVIVPCDYEQTRAATNAMARYTGPGYMRFAREKTDQLTTAKTPFEIGRAQVFKDGKDIALIGCGPVVAECMKAAWMLEQKGVSAMVINMHTVKPLDEKTLLLAARRCGRVITVEEGQITGGLGGAVAEYLSEHHPTKLVRIGVQDHYGESGSPDELLVKFGFSCDHICKVARRMCR